MLERVKATIAAPASPYPQHARRPDNIHFRTKKDHFNAHRRNWRDPTRQKFSDRSLMLARLRRLVP